MRFCLTQQTHPDFPVDFGKTRERCEHACFGSFAFCLSVYFYYVPGVFLHSPVIFLYVSFDVPCNSPCSPFISLLYSFLFLTRTLYTHLESRWHVAVVAPHRIPNVSPLCFVLSFFISCFLSFVLSFSLSLFSSFFLSFFLYYFLSFFSFPQ